jgi:hypothetical protein
MFDFANIFANCGMCGKRPYGGSAADNLIPITLWRRCRH